MHDECTYALIGTEKQMQVHKRTWLECFQRWGVYEIQLSPAEWNKHEESRYLQCNLSERWADFFPFLSGFHSYTMSSPLSILHALQRWAHISPWEIDNMNPITSDKASSRKSSHPKKLIIDTSKNIALQPFLTVKLHSTLHFHKATVQIHLHCLSGPGLTGNDRSRSPGSITDEFYGINPFWSYCESTIHDLALLLQHILKALHPVCFNVLANCLLLLFVMIKFEKAALQKKITKNKHQ